MIFLQMATQRELVPIVAEWLNAALLQTHPRYREALIRPALDIMRDLAKNAAYSYFVGPRAPAQFGGTALSVTGQQVYILQQAIRWGWNRLSHAAQADVSAEGFMRWPVHRL